MNIILDMDGTLIDDNGLYQSRPHLQKFLLYCFNNFDTVSIWTSASREWYDEIYEKIFKHILKGNRFDFVFTRKRCTLDRNSFVYVKNLHKLWRSKVLYKDFNKHNTLIVDNTPFKYFRNYGNGIPIPTYNQYNISNDNYLSKLVEYLEDLYEIFDKYGSIRYTEKRYWFT